MHGCTFCSSCGSMSSNDFAGITTLEFPILRHVGWTDFIQVKRVQSTKYNNGALARVLPVEVYAVRARPYHMMWCCSRCPLLLCTTRWCCPPVALHHTLVVPLNCLDLDAVAAALTARAVAAGARGA